MGERITNISIRAFRAVPEELALDVPNGRSLLILGDNGTGKSTVADALEFFFSGEISPLAREGRGIVYHVGSGRDKTSVAVATTGLLGGQATLEHASPAREVAGRETYLLRGRALADFIDKTKGEKWKSLCDILGIGPVDQLRLDLQQARNALESELTSVCNRSDAAAKALHELCPNPSEEVLFQAISETCTLAGLKPPVSLPSAFRQEWSNSTSERAKIVERAAQIKLLPASFSAAPQFPKPTFAQAWNGVIASIKGVERSRASLLEAARDFLEHSPQIDSCPLCGSNVDDKTLRERVSSMVESLAKWSQALDKARRQLQRLIDNVVSSWEQRTALRAQALKLGIDLPEMPPTPADELRGCLRRNTAVDVARLAEAGQRLADWDAAAIKLTTESLPDIKPEDAALVRVLQLVQLGKTWAAEEAFRKKAEAAVGLAERLHSCYHQRQIEFFSEVLVRISARVATIYVQLHPDDAITNVAVETSGDKGVEMALDFHGRRHRPPHAVLSESHLNSLGIALFLAMAEAFNEHLRFLVLDDVVNSFDIAHRGQLAELLVDEFQDWQLIILTHDPIFFEQLRRRAPNWHSIEFTSWDFDEGPRLGGYQTVSFMEKARERLGEGDLQSAATKGRRALEEILQEPCEGMGASLPFRRGMRNDRREPQELIMGVRRGLKQAGALDDDLKKLLTAIEADLQATLNVESHAGLGRSSRAEVEASLERITQLEDKWICQTCSTKVWAKGPPGSTRCQCGQAVFPSPSLR